MSLITNVKIGNRQLVYSASHLIPLDSQSVEFEFNDEKKLKITFKDDKEKKEVRYEGEASSDGQSYNIILTNFSNNLGEGLMEPIPFYTAENLQHYLMLWVQTNENKSRILEITITRDY